MSKEVEVEVEREAEVLLDPTSIILAVLRESVDRSLGSVSKTIEVVKISFPQGLFLTSIIQVR